MAILSELKKKIFPSKPKNKENTRVIVGLGNPGKEYEKHRHNIGFRLLDYLNSGGEWQVDKKFTALTAKIKIKGQEVLLIKPQSYMNLSGQAVKSIIHYYKIPTANIICAYDDIDLPFNTIRFREKGSAGTHNGMKSMIKELGTENFKRLRLGIENRSEKEKSQRELSSYVLGNFTSEEEKTLPNFIHNAYEELIKRVFI